MRNALIASLVIAAAPRAFAQPVPPSAAPVAPPASTPAEPVTPPPSCAVDIVRAPDDVRAIVLGWVRAEPRCTVALEVRIVPTDGGLYLIARDDRGRTHERVVPDATSAGVLVASWAADDSIATPAASAPPPIAPPAPPPIAPPAPPPARVVIAPAAPPESLPYASPTLAAFVPPGDPASIVARAPGRSRAVHWLTLGAVVPLQDGGEYGARATIDLWTVHGFTIGVAGSVEHEAPFAIEPAENVSTWDADALVTLGRRLRAGAWSLTPAVGVGLRYSHFDTSMSFTDEKSSSLMTLGAASLTLSRAIGARTELFAGPRVNVFPDVWDTFRNVDVGVVAGVGWAP